MIYRNFAELVGKTPLLKADGFREKENISAEIYAKLECFNPAGSVKDRVAVNMLLKAKEKGLIGEGATIIEPTSGNTGIGLAAAAVSLGYKAVLVMPDTMSIERQSTMESALMIKALFVLLTLVIFMTSYKICDYLPESLDIIQASIQIVFYSPFP